MINVNNNNNVFRENESDHKIKNVHIKMNKMDLLDLCNELENVKILCNENDKQDVELILETMLKILKNPISYKRLKCIKVELFNGNILSYSNNEKNKKNYAKTKDHNEEMTTTITRQQLDIIDSVNMNLNDDFFYVDVF